MSAKFEFNDQGIAYQTGRGIGTYGWADIRGLYFPVFGRTPFILTNGRNRIRLDAKNEDLRAAMLGFYAKWAEKFPYLARKNAFDYAEPQASGAILVLSISVLFCMLLAAALFNETWVEYNCSAMLANNPIVQPAEIVKLRKRQQGNFTVALKFQTPSGEVVNGTRLTMRTFGRGDTDPKEISVIYPPDRPSCWQLSESFGKNDINWAKRRYTVAFNLVVGIIFGLVGAFGALTSILRLRQKRPFAEDIAARFRLNVE